MKNPKTATLLESERCALKVKKLWQFGDEPLKRRWEVKLTRLRDLNPRLRHAYAVKRFTSWADAWAFYNSQDVWRMLK